jgi:hypothetical protein
MLAVPVSQQRVLARTDNVVVALSDVRAYPAGCLLILHIAARRRNLDESRWSDVYDAAFEEHRGLRRLRSGELPAELLRVGVQLPDGRRATNVAAPILRPSEEDQSPPSGPVLIESGGQGGSGGGDHLRTTRVYWLWPLPPPQPFLLVVEWPVAGVPLTQTELDGAAIVQAARAAEQLWPDSAD